MKAINQAIKKNIDKASKLRSISINTTFKNAQKIKLEREMLDNKIIFLKNLSNAMK